MKTFIDSLILFWLLLCFGAVSAFGATYPNAYTTNAEPGSVIKTNTANQFFHNFGMTDDDQYSIGSFNGTGTFGRPKHLYVAEDIYGGTLTIAGTGFFGGRVVANLSGGTNITGLAFSSGAATAVTTNLSLTVSNLYQSITLAADCNLTTVSGTGAVSVKFLPGGANRVMSFPTNWCWLSTNGFALSGSLYSATLTNAASKCGWLSLYNSGTDATNVTAAYRQTP